MVRDRRGDVIDKLYRALSDPTYKLAEPEQERLDRLKAIFARWQENPLITDTQMRDYIISQFAVGRSKAYEDISIVKACFGYMPKAEKEFQRMKANRLLEKAAAAAEAGDDRQAKALTKIAETIAKVNHLDQPEGEDFPWDEIVPKDESFSVDPAVIGIEKVPGIEEKARKLLERYTADIDEN